MGYLGRYDRSVRTNGGWSVGGSRPGNWVRVPPEVSTNWHSSCLSLKRFTSLNEPVCLPCTTSPTAWRLQPFAVGGVNPERTRVKCDLVHVPLRRIDPLSRIDAGSVTPGSCPPRLSSLDDHCEPTDWRSMRPQEIDSHGIRIPHNICSAAKP